MAKQKTTETSVSVDDFLNAVEDPARRADGFRLAEIMSRQTGFAPKMWGPSIVGFGFYHYKYESGHEGDAPLAGFSPRAKEISVYLAMDPEKRQAFLERFGKHRSGKGCIYVKKLSDIQEDVLREMTDHSVNYLKSKYGTT